jgi:uncharacterized protein YodC (DUF2158 family)
MTVESVSTEGYCICVWFDLKRQLHLEGFWADDLVQWIRAESSDAPLS